MLKLRSELSDLTDFIPLWVKIAVAVALGLGTTIGWKRIVVTVGEKIGKSHLTYAQGASAEMVAMVTIGVADVYGLPVSTTHILSSGIAGTMAANRSGLQTETLRNTRLGPDPAGVRFPRFGPVRGRPVRRPAAVLGPARRRPAAEIICPAPA